MDYILTTLLSYLLLYKYATIFIVIFTSAIIIPWPGNPLMLAAGAFASQGYLSLSLSFSVALIANVLGDLVGYALARMWGRPALKAFKLDKVTYIASLEAYVKKYAGLTVFVTRFFSTPGSLVNLLSGLSRVSIGRFAAFDIMGNALDIGLFVVSGYVLGTITDNISDIIDIVGWMFVIVIVIFFIVKMFWKKHPAPPHAPLARKS